MPQESTQELRETRSGRRYRLLVTRGMTPRRRNREAIRGNVRALNPNEAEQEETQRASQEHEATEQEQEEIQHASQDADQHHPQRTCAGERATRAAHRRARETPEPEQTTVPEQTTEPVPEQTTIEPLETTTTEPEVTTSDPVQATTTEPAEPSEPEPAQSELQQTGTEPEAAEQSVPGEPEQLAEPEQPAEPELTPEPEQTAAPPPTPSKQPPTPDRPSVVVACPPPKPRAGSPPKKLPDSIPPKTPAQAPGYQENPTCSPCRVLRLTCSPGHRHEHYCHASSSGSGSGFRASQNPTCSPGHRHEHDCHASSSGSGLQQWLRIELPCLPERPAPPRVPRHQSLPQLRVLISLCRRRTPPPPLNRIYLVWQSETKEVLKLTRQAFYERIFPKLLASWFPSTNHLNRGLIVPVHFFETMAEYRLSGAICVELHKVLNRADIEKTYQFLTSRALMILVCLDSEAAFGVDRAVDGHMRLDELALWERTFPFYVKEFPKVFQACEREYLALSEDERKTYDWSIQCHKFRTNTCYREIPAHWDCLFKFTGNA
ncbi:hypothetical protein PAPYR_11042 [Paratrimastix pyriformis]|uniref:Uncharacterized protein n=1 Tax=Paratrimastix pyriformis TaxID=342808 RepID=A0ABQ8U4K9_9EUKA|nr:hypothetical protein PAPYR_11042 [Paratrimastix pyriformis]